jgi:hypothetical protein
VSIAGAAAMKLAAFRSSKYTPPAVVVTISDRSRPHAGAIGADRGLARNGITGALGKGPWR